MSGAYSDVRPVSTQIDGIDIVISALTVHDTVSATCRLEATLECPSRLSSDLLGQDITITYRPGTGKHRKEACRYVTTIAGLEELDYRSHSNTWVYQLFGEHWLDLLRYRVQCRVFQNSNSRAIISKVLDDAGFRGAYRFNISGQARQREYCVQFNESDADFTRRLMADEGWHYHPVVQGNRAILLIGDTNQAFPKSSDYEFPYVRETGQKQFSITEWREVNQLNSTRVYLRDYNETLAQPIDGGQHDTSLSRGKGMRSQLERYRYPASRIERSLMRSTGRQLTESLDGQFHYYHGASHVTTLAVGQRFKLSEHQEGRMNDEYLIISIEHHLRATEAVREQEYRCCFTCIPTNIAFHCTALPKPNIQGLQSATVTGPSNTRIHHDKQGRIKVLFHWDRTGKNDDTTSCWLRVAQSLAGNEFGTQFIPRVGDEVLISFLDGDPDRPVVLASVYNGRHVPPYPVTTQFGIRTHSTPNGNTSNCNELRFNDHTGKEEFWVQAERDWNSLVKNDWNQTIKGKQTTSVEKTANWLSREGMTCKTEDALKVDAKKTAHFNSIDSMTLSSDQTIHGKAGVDMALEAPSAITVDGNTVTVTGKSSIELKVGASKIVVSPTSISLSAPSIEIKASATATLKGATTTVQGQAKADLKGPIVNVSGDAMAKVSAGAMVQVQGAITKIN